MRKPVEIPTAARNATILSVSTNVGDGITLERILGESRSSPDPDFERSLITRTTVTAALSALREAPIPIVLSDCDLTPGTWREMLEYVSVFPDPPLIIVTSRLADERLWAEALNLGAYDVLAKPFEATEVIRILSLAWQHWQDRHGVHSRRTEQRKAATVPN